LRRAQEAAQAARPYAEKLAEMLRTVAARAGDEPHPLLATRDAERTIDVIVVTSDRGLCGGYNANLLRATEAFLRQHPGVTARLTAVGNKGFSYFRKRPIGVADQHTHMPAGPQHELAVQLGIRVARDFAEGNTDGVYVVYSRFRSAIAQVPTVEQLLPLPRPADDDAVLVDYIYEPDALTLLDRLLRQYITTVIDHAFLESIASEQAARMTAMENASANASDMIGRLTLAMNRARQAAITTELMEIVSGAEALKG
jgi:F-type H+-transporting ATPase subunit gamma